MAQVRDESLANVGLHGTYKEYAFFDKVRRLLGNDVTYTNFMRCMQLYVDDVISGRELLDSVQPFTAKFPELARQMRVLFHIGQSTVEPIPQAVVSAHRISKLDVTMDIDYASCRKHGASYRPLPPSYQRPVCSGRTELCNKVLNDVWVSFPMWSEETTFGENKISAYHEFLYQCEDERFELDIVIDNIQSTVEILEEVLNTMSKMTPDDARKYQLDDCLGGTSEVLQKKALQRIYGNKAGDMIEGLKRRPSVAAPIVVRRLKAKVAEWREAQREYNKTWREQNEKQLAKSLLSDAGLFKQAESRVIRSKSLLNEAMAFCDENRSISQIGRNCGNRAMEFFYSDKSIFSNASALLISELRHYTDADNRGQGSDGGCTQAMRRIINEVLPRLIDLSVTSDTQCLKAYNLMYINSTWYIFLRLQHRLCERLVQIRTQAERISKTGVVRAAYLTTPNGEKSSNLYDYTVNMVQCLMEGVIDVTTYEESLRRLYGRHAQITFTLDRLIQHIMKQLQSIVVDEKCVDVLSLFNGESLTVNSSVQLSSDTAADAVVTRRPMNESVYRQRIVELLEDELAFRVTFYKANRRMLMAPVDTDPEPAEDPLDIHRWTDCMDRFVDISSTSNILEESLSQRTNLPVFLNRNKRRMERSTGDLSSRINHVIAEDNIHYQFKPNSYRMNFSANSCSFMFIQGALKKSRKSCKSICQFKRAKFTRWLNAWKREYLTSEQERRSDEPLKRKRFQSKNEGDEGVKQSKYRRAVKQ